MMDDIIAKSLGVRPLAEAKKDDDDPIESTAVEVKEEPEHEVQLPETEDLQTSENINDIEKARKNIENIISLGDSGLKDMMELAKSAESPRAYDTAAGLMKILLEANRDFVETSTKKKYAVEELNGPRETAQTSVTNNNLIVSTADLLKMLKDDKEE